MTEIKTARERLAYIEKKFFKGAGLSFMESKRVLFLNSFIKKGTKQYKGEIETARGILNKYIQGGTENDKA